MNRFPNLLALHLEDAVSILKNIGLRIEVTETEPPGEKTGSGQKRVLAIKEIRPEVVNIIWSYEKYN